jgi:photosystem II stability/assembly factor-like uncharacterized protein
MDNVGPILSLAGNGAGALYSPQMRGLFHTADFARNWEVVRNPGDLYLCDIAVGAAGFGLASGYRGLIATVDFGKTWQPVSVDAMPVSVAANGDAGCLACLGGILFTTADRGAVWRRVETGINGVPSGVCFAGGKCHALFAGMICDATVPKEIVRAKAFELWQNRQSLAPPEPGPFDSDDTLGDWLAAERLLSTRTALLVSDDNWRTWKVDESTERLRPVTFGSGGDTLVLVSYDGVVYCRAVEARWWTAKPRLPQAPWALWVVSDAVWACPDGYHILRTHDAGETWVTTSPSLNMVSGACFITAHRGFAASGNYSATFSVAETTDAAKTWRVVHTYGSR